MIIALLGGSKATIDLNHVMRRRLTVTGSTLRPRPVAFKAAIAAQLRERRESFRGMRSLMLLSTTRQSPPRSRFRSSPTVFVKIRL